MFLRLLLCCGNTQCVRHELSLRDCLAGWFVSVGVSLNVRIQGFPPECWTVTPFCDVEHEGSCFTPAFQRCCVRTRICVMSVYCLFLLSFIQLKGKGLSGTFAMGKKPPTSKVCYSRRRKWSGVQCFCIHWQGETTSWFNFHEFLVPRRQMWSHVKMWWIINKLWRLFLWDRAASCLSCFLSLGSTKLNITAALIILLARNHINTFPKMLFKP